VQLVYFFILLTARCQNILIKYDDVLENEKSFFLNFFLTSPFSKVILKTRGNPTSICQCDKGELNFSSLIIMSESDVSSINA
jgi:hypothetical protein